MAEHDGLTEVTVLEGLGRRSGQARGGVQEVLLTLPDLRTAQEAVGELDGLPGHGHGQPGALLGIATVTPGATPVCPLVRLDDPLTGGDVVAATERCRRLAQEAIDVSLQLAGPIEVVHVTGCETPAQMPGSVDVII